MFGDLLKQVVDFHENVVRNIKGIRVTQSLFDDISEDPLDQAVAIAAENATLIPSFSPLITRPFDYGTVITYPFVPHNWQATRFSDGLEYGVWYGSLEIETTVYESVYHWHRFVMDSFPKENRTIRGERRIFRVNCGSILIDLRGKERNYPKLIGRLDYTFTQQLGRYLNQQNQNGLITKSARHSGFNTAVFKAQALSNPRDVCYLTYFMNPTVDEVMVERKPKKRWLSVTPSELA